MTELPNYDLELVRSAAHHDPDWFLQDFVDAANRGDMEIGLTLLVKGTVVTGRVISGGKYFEQIGEQIGVAAGMDKAKAVTLFKSVIDEYNAKGDDSGNVGDELPLPPGFIHLTNAKIFQGANLTPESQEGVLWRGRLAEVDGFILGEMTQGA